MSDSWLSNSCRNSACSEDVISVQIFCPAWLNDNPSGVLVFLGVMSECLTVGRWGLRGG